MSELSCIHSVILQIFHPFGKGMKEIKVTKRKKTSLPPCISPTLIKISLDSFYNWLSEFFSTAGALFTGIKANNLEQ